MLLTYEFSFNNKLTLSSSSPRAASVWCEFPGAPCDWQTDDRAQKKIFGRVRLTHLIKMGNIPSRAALHKSNGFIRGILYGTDWISYYFLVTSFSHLFWYCHICRLLNVSHLNSITIPTPLPNATLTIGAAAHNPNYRGSRVYPNYRGSRTQP